jgi:hypothetical protein
MFADDTNLFFTDSNTESLQKKVNTELSKISTWFKLNKLSLNIKKTNFMFFNNKQKPTDPTPDINIDNVKIEKVDQTKFLGVIINSKLTWDDHIRTVIQKMQKNIGIIFRIRQKIPTNILLLLYQTLVHPYIEYCNIIWAIRPGIFLNKLIVCQKRAIRTITFSHFNAHTAPLFRKLNILSAHNVNRLQVACFMYQAMHNSLPPHYCAMFTKNCLFHSYNTRQSDKVHITTHRLNIKRFTIRIFGPTLWNQLPQHLTQAPNLVTFKRLYRKHLLELDCPHNSALHK